RADPARPVSGQRVAGWPLSRVIGLSRIRRGRHARRPERHPRGPQRRPQQDGGSLALNARSSAIQGGRNTEINDVNSSSSEVRPRPAAVPLPAATRELLASLQQGAISAAAYDTA